MEKVWRETLLEEMRPMERLSPLSTTRDGGGLNYGNGLGDEERWGIHELLEDKINDLVTDLLGEWRDEEHKEDRQEVIKFDAAATAKHMENNCSPMAHMGNVFSILDALTTFGNCWPAFFKLPSNSQFLLTAEGLVEKHRAKKVNLHFKI